MGCDRTGWGVIGQDGVEWDRMGWNGTGWGGMGQDGTGWSGIHTYVVPNQVLLQLSYLMDTLRTQPLLRKDSPLPLIESVIFSKLSTPAAISNSFTVI